MKQLSSLSCQMSLTGVLPVPKVGFTRLMLLPIKLLSKHFNRM
jgi:hypothetical protein